MQLEDKWSWKERKLTCRVEPETGNPAGDDLRARFVELAGKDLEEMNKMYDTLGMMKDTKRRKETEKKGVQIVCAMRGDDAFWIKSDRDLYSMYCTPQRKII